MRIRQQQPLAPKVQDKQAKIAMIRMQMAKVEEAVQNGSITPEEGRIKLAALEAQLAEVENPVTPEVQPQQADTIVEKPQPGVEKNPNEEYMFGENDFYAQQAKYNRALFGL